MIADTRLPMTAAALRAMLPAHLDIIQVLTSEGTLLAAIDPANLTKPAAGLLYERELTDISARARRQLPRTT